MEQMTFRVPQMDCPAEEQLVRMQLAGRAGVRRLAFDLPGRTVVITHADDGAEIERLMGDLNLGAALVGRENVAELEAQADDGQQRRVLITVLLINAGLFVLELAAGLLAQSMGLVADSLDMLADAIVYSLSLYAVGQAAAHKQRVARLSGYFQLLLAAFGVVEVARRFLGAGDEPSFSLMIGISLLALAGNVASLVVLQRARSQEVHMRASWIFTTNDVLVNIGVIVAGALVFATGSKVPDLLVGAAVFCLVGYGAFRILRISR
ncbi:MAG: cation transporter [Oscillochloris sp.]|nr:cation transporter [Oscillochloris sp.]